MEEINKRLPDLAIIDIKLDKHDKDGIDLLKLVIKKKKNCYELSFLRTRSPKMAVSRKI